MTSRFRSLPHLVATFDLSQLIKRAKSSQLFLNTSWMLTGQVLSMVIQAIYFVLIARALGPQGYGAFISTTALVGLFASLTCLGINDMMIMKVARGPDCFPIYWGKSLLISLLVGSIFSVVVLAISQFAYADSVPFSLILTVAISDLILAPILDISGYAYQSFQRLNRTALLRIMPSLLRLIAIAGLALFVQQPTVSHWGYLYLINAIISTTVALWLVSKELGLPRLTLFNLKADIAEGLHFFASILAQNVYTNVDKILLGRFYDSAAVGIYGAAYRLIDVAFSPILALLSATYARFFQHGETGISASAAFAKKIFPFAAGFGVLVWIMLAVMAPVFPYVLGEKYAKLVEVLILLAPIPLIKAIFYFAADTLSGAGFQWLRSRIQILAAFFNAGLNFWLIPLYGWRGAAWTSIATNLLLASLTGLALFYLLKREKSPTGVVMTGSLKEAGILEKSFVVVALLMFTSPFIAILPPEHNVVELIVFYSIYILTLYFFRHQLNEILLLAKREKFLLCLVAVAVFSSIWSDFPLISLRRSVSLIGTCLFGIYFAQRYTLQKQLQFLAIMFGLAAVLSVFFSLFLPAYGLSKDHEGAWQGIFDQKNVLGHMMLVSSVIFALLCLDEAKYRWLKLMLLMLTFVLLVRSQSVTSLVMALVIFSLMMLYKTLQWHFYLRVALFCLAIVLGIAAALWASANQTVILHLLDRSSDLTGRIELWESVIPVGERHAFLGHGYNVFWLKGGAGDKIKSLIEWDAPSSHNGYLDVWLELGLLGLILFGLSMLQAFYNAVQYIKQQNTWCALWPLCYLTYLFFANWLESDVFRHNSIYSVLYIACATYFYRNGKQEDLPLKTKPH